MKQQEQKQYQLQEQRKKQARLARKQREKQARLVKKIEEARIKKKRAEVFACKRCFVKFFNNIKFYQHFHDHY